MSIVYFFSFIYKTFLINLSFLINQKNYYSFMSKKLYKDTCIDYKYVFKKKKIFFFRRNKNANKQQQ